MRRIRINGVLYEQVMNESRVNLTGSTVEPSVEYVGAFFEKDGRSNNFFVDAGTISGGKVKSECYYTRITFDNYDVFFISPEKDDRLFKNLSRALEKFSDLNYVGYEDLIDGFEEFCDKYGFTERVESRHVS